VKSFNSKRTEVNPKVDLPKDFHWTVFRLLLEDLEIDTEVPDIMSAIRARSVTDLLSAKSVCEPRSILANQPEKAKDASLFFRLYQAGSFLKKYPFPGTETFTPAFEAFKSAERVCLLYNKENYKAIEVLSQNSPEYLGVLDEIQADVLSLLGENPDMSYVYGHARSGPGVCIGSHYKKGKATKFYKLSSLPYSVTDVASSLAKSMITDDPRWIGALDDWYRRTKKISLCSPIDLKDFWNSVLEVVPGSRLITVPKTAKTDRFIAIEPHLNVMLQLGVDKVIKNRLKKWGYDLTSQALNQELACQGSMHDNLCTLDLKAASDTISLKVCEMLLPASWYALLLDLRSSSGVLQSENFECKFEKISSMGNGYTFAIESLIFAAIVRCAIRRTKAPRTSAVFGDDLVVPIEAKDFCIDLLQLFGFTLNMDKSFSSGPFRESCGKDFIRGVDVRPIFLTDVVKTVNDLFYVHNSLYVLQESKPWYFGLDFCKTLQYIKKFIPKCYRRDCFGPVSDSLDTYLFSNKNLRKNMWGQRVILTLRPTAKVFIRPRSKSSRYYKDYFFLKLMAPLGQSKESDFWRKRTEASSGNVFYITRRGQVRYHLAKKIVY
jgi:hypothetical protein